MHPTYTKCYLAVHLPAPFERIIREAQSLATDNTLQHKIRPHITIKSPAHVPTSLDWLDAVEAAVATSGPLTLTVGRPERFGDDVLHLPVTGNGLHALHRRIMGVFDIPDEVAVSSHEGDAYTPHLTVALRWENFSESDFDAIERTLLLYPLPYTFEVDRVDLLAKSGIWETIQTLPLSPRYQ